MMTAIVRVLISDVARRGRKTHTHLSTEMIMVRYPEVIRDPVYTPMTLLRTDHFHQVWRSGLKKVNRQEELARVKKKTYMPSTRDRQNRHRFIRSFIPARRQARR